MGVAIDPVCDMEVDQDHAAATSVYRDQTYYFCAPGCKAAFDLEPEQYLRREAGIAGDVSAPTAPTISMPVDVAIKTRRSVARLKPDPVPGEAIELMLEAAVWAPNHHLTEPWEFFVLSGDSLRRFAEIRRDFRRTLFKHPEAPEVQRALDKIYADTITTPVIIVVTTTNPDDQDLRDDDYGATMIAIQNMLLVATGLGLGVYLRTGRLIRFPPLREWLAVTEGRRIAGVIYVGYPAHIPERRRTPHREKTHWMA